MERPLGKASSRNADYEGEEPAASVDEATPSLMRNDDAERQLALLRKECKTSQIVIHALREKDEESQVRAQEFAASQMPAIWPGKSHLWCPRLNIVYIFQGF